MEKINHWRENHIVCPYCGYKFKDSWEYGGMVDESLEIDCESCDKKFVCEIEVVRRYTTEKIGED